MLRRIALALTLAVHAAACGHAPPAEVAPPAPAPVPVTITVVGTSDLHGHVEQLPLLAGYIDNLRADRDRDGGGVIAVDAGDMFQGTLASNLGEGAAVIDAYNTIGFAAAAIGNHEFDFGPAGDAPTPTGPDDDPRGALKARAAQATFPLLAANLIDAQHRARVDWPNVTPSTVVEVAGATVGIIGVTTEGTAQTTMAANFAGLETTPLADAIAAEAGRLRADGAAAIIVAAHAGGGCKQFEDPDDLASCDPEAEIFRVAHALPAGAVDVIVAGHSHQAIAHRVNGIAVAQAYAYGKAFARIDMTIVGDSVVDVRLSPPVELCADPADCSYDGAPVTPSHAVAAAIAPAIEHASAARNESLGVELSGPVARAYAAESALGNLFTDLMLAARPDADVALTNGGGLRADLPAGELTYGALYEAAPFDNGFATVRLRASQLAALVANNLRGSHGVFSLAGALVAATCVDGELVVTLYDARGTALADGTELTVVTSDFLASGGDGAFARLGLDDDAIRIDSGPTIRDAMADVLRGRAGELAVEGLLDPARPRLKYPGRRPVSCTP